MALSQCAICGRMRAEFPMVFRDGDFCSDNCRKKLDGEIPLENRDLKTMASFLESWVRSRRGMAGLWLTPVGEPKYSDLAMAAEVPPTKFSASSSRSKKKRG